jgi:hypothetical protein
MLWILSQLLTWSSSVKHRCGPVCFSYENWLWYSVNAKNTNDNITDIWNSYTFTFDVVSFSLSVSLWNVKWSPPNVGCWLPLCAHRCSLISFISFTDYVQWPVPFRNLLDQRLPSCGPRTPRSTRGLFQGLFNYSFCRLTKVSHTHSVIQ